ncbi:BA14K-like protein [Hoeflea sp. IMCC20628]|uniref:BA14K family protein n=1 Tax=Hoeflea sp. IMCC20628 TaxID=1620421 RepID=UPI00063BF27A|nr:BA14K family protein [Hoeflea sp. IMCC20628]AKH99447.1 BA14K-like protein [Hoeflea sp. IMCC20628]
MNTFAKKLSITMLTAATAFAPLTPTMASAGESGAWHQEKFGQNTKNGGIYRQNKHRGKQYNYRQDRHGRRGGQDSNSDAIVLGIIGLGVGAIIGGAIQNSNNQPRVMYRSEPVQRDYYPEAPRAASSGYGEPWTQSWYNYCEDHYRSFNASTGTYRGYDGQDHFCVAK